MQGLYWTEPVPAAVRFGDAMTAEMIGDFALATEGAAPIDELRQVEASAATLYFGAWSGRSECAPTPSLGCVNTDSATMVPSARGGFVARLGGMEQLGDGNAEPEQAREVTTVDLTDPAKC